MPLPFIRQKRRSFLNTGSAAAPLLSNDYTLDFDGSADGVSVPDSNDFSFGDAATDSPFSISAWVNADSWLKFRILSKGNNTTTESEYIFGGDGASKLSIYLFDAANANNIGRSYNTVLNTSQWYHVGVTYDGGGVNTGIELYVDGVKQTAVTNQSAGTYVAMHNTPGTLRHGYSYVPDYGNGKIGGVSMFSSELAEAEMAEIFSQGYKYDLRNNIEDYVSSGNLIEMWDYSTGSGTTLSAFVNGSHDGSFVGTPTWSSSIPS